jgi:hypothetical protein
MGRTRWRRNAKREEFEAASDKAMAILGRIDKVRLARLGAIADEIGEADDTDGAAGSRSRSQTELGLLLKTDATAPARNVNPGGRGTFARRLRL